MSKWRKIMRIPSLRILRSYNRDAIPRPCSVVENVEIVAVQVHGVRTGVVVVDYDADGCVGPKVHDVPFWIIGIGVVLLLSEEEDGVIVVALEGVTVHVEELLASCVHELVDCYVICYAGLGKRDRVEGDCLVQRLLAIDQRVLRKRQYKENLRLNTIHYQLDLATRLLMAMRRSLGYR